MADGKDGRDLPSNVERLRGDIDSGRTGEKVKVGDPAAAPLGSDAEAGGAPPSGEDVSRAMAQEGQAPVAKHRSRHHIWLGLALALISAVAVIVALWTVARP